MQTYLVPPDGVAIPVPAAPGTRAEAIALISQLQPSPIAGGAFRVVTIGEFDVSPDESCEIEHFAVGLRHYGGGRWGLIEASATANQASGDFCSTPIDVLLWLKSLRDCWPMSVPDLSCTLEQVDDFHVLQFFDGSRLLSSITWNAPDAGTAYRMPGTLELPQHLWGDALLSDVGQLYDALRALNLLSLRK